MTLDQVRSVSARQGFQRCSWLCRPTRAKKYWSQTTSCRNFCIPPNQSLLIKGHLRTFFEICHEQHVPFCSNVFQRLVSFHFSPLWLPRWLNHLCYSTLASTIQMVYTFCRKLFSFVTSGGSTLMCLCPPLQFTFLFLRVLSLTDLHLSCKTFRRWQSVS